MLEICSPEELLVICMTVKAEGSPSDYFLQITEKYNKQYYTPQLSIVLSLLLCFVRKHDSE